MSKKSRLGNKLDKMIEEFQKENNLKEGDMFEFLQMYLFNLAEKKLKHTKW